MLAATWDADAPLAHRSRQPSAAQDFAGGISVKPMLMPRPNDQISKLIIRRIRPTRELLVIP